MRDSGAIGGVAPSKRFATLFQLVHVAPFGRGRFRTRPVGLAPVDI